MSYMRIRTLFFILPIIAIAGCTLPSGIFPGQDVIKAVPSTQEEGPRDVLVIKDIGTIPKSPVLAGQNILLSFVIENLDAEKEAKDVVVELFDAPLFKNKAGVLCNSGKDVCVPTGNECTSSNKCTILPGEQKQITYDLFAPDDKAIANLEASLDLNFRVQYAFSGSTLLKLVVVNLEEIKARQRAESQITLDILKSVGSGPVKIDVELKGSNYMLSGMSGTLGFIVKTAGDTGKGSLLYSKIPEKTSTTDGLRIVFPAELINNDIGNIERPSKFLCQLVTGKEAECYNIKDIELIKGESSILLFRVLNTAQIDVPFKSFDIKAFLAYTYELRNSAKITVIPLSKIR